MNRIVIGNTRSRARIDVGEGLTTKVNLIVGANSREQIEVEQQKIQLAVRLGVHTIIDLSCTRLETPLWQWGRERYPDIAFGKVCPILVSVDLDGEVPPDALWKEIVTSVEAGVDYMTMNLVPRTLEEFYIARERDFATTSRQGGVLLKYMLRHKCENPYYAILDDMLALFRQYNVTIHIGSTFRPTGITEAYDAAHSWELERQMELYQIFDEAGVPAIVEPFSHQPLSDLGPGIKRLREAYGAYVPFQMLGPIVTERNFDCDQYAAASGAAMAAMHNVGKVTTIPPGEHLRFPTLHDTAEGIKATLTSVHAGDLCRIPELIEEDRRITRSRGAAQSCNGNSSEAGCEKCAELCPLLLGNLKC